MFVCSFVCFLVCLGFRVQVCLFRLLRFWAWICLSSLFVNFCRRVGGPTVSAFLMMVPGRP